MPQPQPADIVFICGALRSGSTLLALMLDRNPALKNPGEFDFLFDPFGDPTSDQSGGMAKALAMDGTTHQRGFDVHRIYLAHGLPFDWALRPRERVLDYVERLREPGKVLTINLHRNFAVAAEFFPQARFVHLIRDPRDVAMSAMNMGWSGVPYFGTWPWTDAERSWDRLAASVVSDRTLELRYESLVSEPAHHMKDLCGFLGVDYTPAMLDLAGTTYENPSAAFTYQWKRKLSAREAAEIDARVRPLIGQRGYPPAGPAMPPPSGRRLLQLRWRNRVNLIKFSATRFGWGHALIAPLIHRLPGTAVNRWLWRRTNRLNTPHLR